MDRWIPLHRRAPATKSSIFSWYLFYHAGCREYPVNARAELAIDASDFRVGWRKPFDNSRLPFRPRRFWPASQPTPVGSERTLHPHTSQTKKFIFFLPLEHLAETNLIGSDSWHLGPYDFDVRVVWGVCDERRTRSISFRNTFSAR